MNVKVIWCHSGLLLNFAHKLPDNCMPSYENYISSQTKTVQIAKSHVKNGIQKYIKVFNHMLHSNRKIYG